MLDSDTYMSAGFNTNPPKKHSPKLIHDMNKAVIEEQDKEIGLKYDEGKLRYGLLPPQPLRRIVQVFTFGAKKYGDYNWSHVENGISRYTDALLRHIEAWRYGEKYDKETGIHHLAHAGANILFLLFFDEKSETPTP